MKKRLLSAALVLCLLLALLPMAAFADDDVQTGTCGDGLTWTLDAAGTLTVTGSGVISANAFAFNSKIVRAEIGAGVTGIGLWAFLKCANLEAVTLPAGLTTLGTAAFAYCEKLASVTLPGSLKSTGGGAFQGCTALTAVTILPGVTRIDTRAFSDCAALKEITIPATVTAIGGSAFSGCLALRTVHFGGSKEAWQAVEVGEHNTLLRLAKVDYNAVTEHHFGDWAVTTEATCTEPGVRTRTCTDPGCAETETESIPALGHDWGESVTVAEPNGAQGGRVRTACKRCGAETLRFTDPEIPAYQQFDDVDLALWSYPGIAFCVKTGLMSGTDAHTFAPHAVTTRAQIVQILYNLAGEPAVTGTTPFTDLTNDWYQDAILWAYQTGVVAGTSATTFDPESPVTREQIAGILMGYADMVQHLKHTWTPADLCLPGRSKRVRLGAGRHGRRRGAGADLRRGDGRRHLPAAAGRCRARAGRHDPAEFLRQCYGHLLSRPDKSVQAKTAPLRGRRFAARRRKWLLRIRRLSGIMKKTAQLFRAQKENII